MFLNRTASFIVTVTLALSLASCKDKSGESNGTQANGAAASSQTNSASQNSGTPIPKSSMPKTISAAGAENQTPTIRIADYPPDVLNPVDLNYIPYKCLDGMLSLSVPDSFRPMTDKELSIKYTGTSRPDVALTASTTAINLTATYTDIYTGIGQLYEYHKLYEQQMKKLYPDAQWISNELTTTNGRPSWISQFRRQLIDTEVYFMVWGTSVHERILLVTFTLPRALEDKWVPIGNEILTSATIDESSDKAGDASEPAEDGAGADGG